ncbi:MAG: alpha-amylase family glycosyl hydrolase [Bacteroidota bacterium]
MRIALDGEWLFLPDSARGGVEQGWYGEACDRSGWSAVEIPRFWEGYPGLSAYDGWGWFARRFVVPRTGEPMSLHFAGVDDDARLWLNGVEAGSHTGYSDPFTVPAEALREGENLLVVLVADHGGGGGIYKPVTLIETRRLEELLRGPLYGTPARRSADWVKDAVIYQVYLRSFSPEGTFTGLERRLGELKKLGVTVLWLMPIHPVGAERRKGSLGSPYAVRDFRAVNPEFGTMEDFKRLLNAAHREGLKVILDLVINHTSWDNPLLAGHPDWYTRNARGQVVPPNADWTDVADLDYASPGLRRSMTEMMRWWVRDVGIDGFRCDVAELVPTDFWEDVRRELDRIKPVMMLSEGTLPEHHRKAFDLTYSWNIYDALGPLLEGKRPPELLDEIFRAEALQFPTGSLRMRFNTNHDKNAWDEPAILRYGPPGLKLSAVLVNTIPGVPLLYNGEEVANDRRLSLFEKVEIDWKRPRTMGDLYGTLFRLRARNKSLSRGEMIRLSGGGDAQVYAFARAAGKDRVVVVLNFSAQARRARVELPESVLRTGRAGTVLTEVFSGRKLRPAADGLLETDLEPLGYRVYTVSE